MSNRRIEELPERELFSLCIYGEARGEPIEGKVAVASVIMNRFKKAKSIREVILRPKQFSCFNLDDPNHAHLEEIAADFSGLLRKSQILKHCYWVACGFIDGWLSSNIGASTHYHTKSSDPKWDDKMKLVATIGSHEFFVETA